MKNLLTGMFCGLQQTPRRGSVVHFEVGRTSYQMLLGCNNSGTINNRHHSNTKSVMDRHLYYIIEHDGIMREINLLLAFITLYVGKLQREGWQSVIRLQKSFTAHCKGSI